MRSTPPTLRARLKFGERLGAPADILLAGVTAAFIAALLLSPRQASADGPEKTQRLNTSTARLRSELTGTVATHDGQRLHLVTDLGKIIIKTQNSGKIDYTVLLEADASQKDAKQLLKSFLVSAHATPDGVYFRGQSLVRRATGRLWVTVELIIPKNYNVDVMTGGGNIETEDVNGSVTLATAGGNIVAGNIGGPAHLTTDGGHITVKNVAGELVAATGGGHITTGAIEGNASLHTSGGHITSSVCEWNCACYHRRRQRFGGALWQRTGRRDGGWADRSGRDGGTGAGANRRRRNSRGARFRSY